MTENILLTRKLPNGIRVTFYDMSKRLAADRWLVKVRCEAVLALAPEDYGIIDDLELLDALKQKFAGGVTHTIVRERNFIDEREKDAICQELLSQLEENAFVYLGGERFPASLLEKKIGDFRKEFELERKRSAVAGAVDEDDGPADFSACFRD